MIKKGLDNLGPLQSLSETIITFHKKDLIKKRNLSVKKKKRKPN